MQCIFNEKSQFQTDRFACTGLHADMKMMNLLHPKCFGIEVEAEQTRTNKIAPIRVLSLPDIFKLNSHFFGPHGLVKKSKLIVYCF